MTGNRNTVLLTGLPRSGTTLTCALLNEFHDTIALAEPISLDPSGGSASAVKQIREFITTVRSQAPLTNEAVSTHVDGVVPDNWANAPSGNDSLRKVVVSHGVIRLNKPLSSEFHLIIKHPAEFSALANLLSDSYPLVAQVRHPLAVLAAWQTVDMPINRGHMPMAEVFLPNLSAVLSATSDRLKRQIILIDWLLRTYAEFPVDRILRYEDLVTSPAPNLARFTAYASQPTRAIHSYDLAERYSGVDLSMLARQLLPLRSVAEKFYPDFEESLTPWLRTTA